MKNWRRGRDSNPGWSYPHNCLAGSCLQPLGHLSGLTTVRSSKCGVRRKTCFRSSWLNSGLRTQNSELILSVMAEREGFEPPELSLNGFQDRRLKPLGHLDRKSTRLNSSHQLISYAVFCLK